MDFSISEKDGISIFVLEGNLIGENDGIRITERFFEILEEDKKNFILDLSNLKHINSSGLAVLITMLTKARNRSGELILVNPSETINKLLIITKLSSIFSIHKSVEEGLTFFNNEKNN